MRFLYLTDSHIRGSNPKSRLDNFQETLLEKLEEVNNIAMEKNVDYILHGGDLFDRPDVSLSVINDFSRMFTNFHCPIYIISGNHDIFGHNPKTINRTILGLLVNLGVFNLVNDRKIILEKDGIRVQLTGYPYTNDMDYVENIENYKVLEVEDGVDYSIHMTHGFLMDKPILKGIPHTLIEDIKDTKADITLAGHFHLGYKTVCIDNKCFINPGALVRVSNSILEINRKPKVVIIDLKDKITLEEVYLKSAKPGVEILDRSEIESHKNKRSQLYKFQEIINSTSNFVSLDIISLITQIATNENLPDEVRLEAIKRFEAAQIREAEKN